MMIEPKLRFKADDGSIGRRRRWETRASSTVVYLEKPKRTSKRATLIS